MQQQLKSDLFKYLMTLLFHCENLLKNIDPMDIIKEAKNNH